MRAQEFLNEQQVTDQDARMFLIGLLTNAYSLNIKALPMKGLLKSLLDSGYLRDAKWVLNVINNLPDDENLVVDKQASDREQVVIALDEPDAEAAQPAPEDKESEEVIDKMARDALNKRMP